MWQKGSKGQHRGGMVSQVGPIGLKVGRSHHGLINAPFPLSLLHFRIPHIAGLLPHRHPRSYPSQLCEVDASGREGAERLAVRAKTR